MIETALLGVLELVIAVGACVLAFVVRVPLAYAGMAAAVVGLLLTVGLTAQGNTQTIWPVYLIFGGLAATLPMLMGGI